MQFKKITDKGKAGNFYVGKSEILIINWNNGTNPDFFAFDESRELRQVTKEYFAAETIGEHYKRIEEQLPLSIENYQSTKDEKGNHYFCFYQEGIIHGFDQNAKRILEWEAEEIGQGHSIYDIGYQNPDTLWLAFPTGHTVTQVSISERKEKCKIGAYTWDDKHTPLSYPESVFVKGNCVYISNMGNSHLFGFDNEAKELELIETFDEKLWQYEETALGTFIVTDTGIYEVVQ